MDNLPLVSIIIPVKNEERMLDKCLKSLQGVEYPKERLEIIVSDGHSTDKSKEIALRYGTKMVTNDKEIVVSGRNRGFEISKGDIVVFTEADCIFDSKWVKNSIKYFADSNIGGGGGRILMPNDSSSFEKAIDIIFNVAELFHMTSHRKNVSSVIKVDDIPGGNAFYRRQALEKVMPVDENLLTAEDSLMNLCIRRLGYQLVFASDVMLWHYHRSSFKRFARQTYRYAIGRLQVGKKERELISMFHILSGFSLPIFLFAGFFCYLSGFWNIFSNIMLIFIAIAIAASFIKIRSLAVSLNTPIAIFIFFSSWSIGFLKELFFPLKDAKGK